MNWKQQIAAWFGASYIMHRDSTWGFRVARVYRRNGYYWLKKDRTFQPIKKVSMAKDLHTLVNNDRGSDGTIDQKDQWTPLTKTMKAWYVMLEDAPST